MPGVFDLYATITLNTDGYKRELGEAAKATGQTANQIGVKTVAIGTLVADMIKKGGQAFVNMAKTGIEYNAQIETYTSALTTALGSEAAAAAAIEQIKVDAAKTPYSVDGLVKANSYLISAGESAQSARATIMALSDAVSATGGGNAELQRMAQNLQQVKNVGKATSMDIRQFAMAGIDVYGLLADYTGKTTAEVQELDVTYEMLSGALRQAASVGGRFYQANARQAATMNGQISTLSDNVTAKLGEAFASVSATLSGKVLPAVNKFVEGVDVDKVTAAFGRLAKAAGVIGGIIAAQKVSSIVGGWVAAFQTAQLQLALYSMSVGSAGVAQGVLNGELTVGEILVGVMTGKISLATAAQAAWNAAVAAFPAAIVAAGVAAIGLSVADNIKNFNDYVEAQSSVGDTAEEVAANLENLRAREAELKELNESGWGTEMSVDELDRVQAAIRATEERLEALKQAEAGAASGHETAFAAMIPPTERAMQVTDEFKQGLDTVVSAYKKTYDDISKKVSGWFGLFDTAKVNVKTSVKEMTDAMQSQIDFNTSYSSNLNALATYGLPEVGEAFQQMGADGAAYAETLVAAIEDAGGATSEGGQEIINSFREMSQGVSDSQADLSAALTNVTGEFDAAFGDLLSSAQSAVEGMDLSGDAAAAAANMINAYIGGISAGAGGAEGAAARVAAAAARGLGSASGRVGHGSVSVPLFASGTDYIPYDNFPAVLHKGEMVVPAKISEDLRDFVKGGGTETGIAPSAPVANSGEIIGLLKELIAATKRPVVLDTGELVGGIGNAMDRQLGSVNEWGGRELSLA